MSHAHESRSLPSARRWLKRGLLTVGIGVVALTVLVLLALDLQPTKEFVRAQVNTSLSELFRGRILIDRIGSLRLDAIAGIDARLLDAQGHEVVKLRGLRVRSNWPQLLRALVFGKSLDIVLEPLTVDHLDVWLRADSEGLPTLASAFVLRENGPVSTALADESDLVWIRLGDLHVRHLWAHGSLPSIPVIDADLSDLRGSFEYGERGLTAELVSGRLRARGLPVRVDPSGSLTAHVLLPVAEDAPFSGAARFEGQLASAQAMLTVDWRLPLVDAVLLAPSVAPATLQAILPRLKLNGPTNLEARVRGRLPTLDFDATAQNQVAEAHLNGQVLLEATTRVTCELVASNLDLGTVLSDGTKTSLSVAAAARASIANGGVVRGEYRVVAPPGRFGVFDTPSVVSSGKIQRESDGALKLDGRLEVEEPGVPAQADYLFSATSEGSLFLHAKFNARLSNPPRLRKLTGLSLMGSVAGTADLDLSSQYLSARVTSKFAHLIHPSASVKNLQLALKVDGAFASPQLELRADAGELSTSGQRFQKVALTASGKPDRLRVAASAEGKQQHWRTEAQLQIEQDIVVNKPRISFSDREGEIKVTARRVRVIGSKIQIDDLVLTGLGEVRATGSFSPRRANAMFAIRDLDLGRVSRLSGIGFAKKGKLSLLGKVEGPLVALEGSLQGQVRDLDLGTDRVGNLDVDLALAGRRVNGTLNGKFGHSELNARLSDLDLPAAPFTVETLQALHGQLSLRAKLDLRQLTPALRSVGIPLERARGQLELEVQATNPRAGEHAGRLRLDAHAKSEGLVLIEQRVEDQNVKTPREAREAKPLALEGVDVDARVVLDPWSEHAEVHVLLSDAQGPLLTVNGEAKIDLSLATNFAAKFDSVPLHVSLRAPERAMEKLPSALRPSVMRGLASFELEAEGTVRDPKLRAKLAIRRLQARDGGRNAIDLVASTEYANTGGKLEGEAKATRGGVATLRTAWVGNLIQQLQSAGAARPGGFELSSDLVLQKFPVAVIPALSDRQVRGRMSGEVHLRGLGKDARLNARFDGSGITVNRVALPRLYASLVVSDKELSATLDATQTNGMAEAKFSAPSAWGARWAPKLDSRAKLQLKARAFELEALSPLLMRYVSTLEGLLDADVSAHLDPKSPNILGTATLTKGVFQIPQLGQRFTDVQAKVSVRDNEIRVDTLQARGVTGRLTGEARATLNGTALKSATARVVIKEREKLPITLEGVVFGDAWGEATLSYAQSREDATTEIKINVPAFRLEMPEAAQNSVQDLDPADDIRIGARRSDGKFVTVPLQPVSTTAPDGEGEAPALTRVQIHLGDSVWIDRGRQANVQLAGDLELESGAKQVVTGRIELRGGKLDVSGKRFEIERGVISFEGNDASNPTITATARWDSPAEYTVYAEYSGTVENGKLRLRSEPSLSQDEILSLLLFGSPGGSMASSAGGSDSSAGAGAAVSVAGGTATKGLNRAISDVTSIDVSTRIDTSTGSARPELVVQLTPRLTTRITRAIGEPSPGQSPDRTFLTLEFRLSRYWALSAVVGDQGASTLDLIWRKRY